MNSPAPIDQMTGADRAEEIQELRLLSKTIGLTPAQDERFHALAEAPAKAINAELAALSAKLDEPFLTTAALTAFVRSAHR